MKKIAVSLAMLLVITRIQAEPEIKGSPTELTQYLAAALPKMTSLTGEATAKAPADNAVVTLKVTTDNRALQGALRANQDIRSKVLVYLKEQGLAADRVKSSRFSSTPEFGWTGDKAKSYHIENMMRISVQDETELLAVAGAVDNFAEVQYVSTDFELAKKAEMKAEALSKACDNALERKKAYEEKFGVKLVLKNFHEAELGEPEKLMIAQDKNTQNNNSGWASRSAEAVMASPAFGEFTCSARVVIECSVEPK